MAWVGGYVGGWDMGMVGLRWRMGSCRGTQSVTVPVPEDLPHLPSARPRGNTLPQVNFSLVLFCLPIALKSWQEIFQYLFPWAVFSNWFEEGGALLEKGYVILL